MAPPPDSTALHWGSAWSRRGIFHESTSCKAPHCFLVGPALGAHLAHGRNGSNDGSTVSETREQTSARTPTLVVVLYRTALRGVISDMSSRWRLRVKTSRGFLSLVTLLGDSNQSVPNTSETALSWTSRKACCMFDAARGERHAGTGEDVLHLK